MVDRAKHNAVGFQSLQAPHTRANRGELPLFPFVVNHHEGRIKFRGRTNFVGARAQHDARHSDLRMARSVQQMLQEGAVAVGMSAFGLPIRLEAPAERMTAASKEDPFLTPISLHGWSHPV